MRLKVHNSKSSMMILIFLCLTFSESSSQDLNSEFWLLNVGNITQTNFKTSDYNIDFKIGLSSYVFQETKWHTVLIEKFDVLQFGYNFDGIDNFISFNLYKYEGINSTNNYWIKSKYTGAYRSQSLDLISINKECISQNETNWIKLGLGTGYDFIQEHDEILLAEGLMKIGYTNLELNKSVGELLNSNTALNFDGIEIELGPRFQYIDENFKLILVSNFKKIFAKRDLNILENGIEIVFIINTSYGFGVHVESGDMVGTASVPVFEEILNFTLFGNYNLYSTNNTTTAIPIVGLKLKVYAGLFADR